MSDDQKPTCVVEGDSDYLVIGGHEFDYQKDAGGWMCVWCGFNLSEYVPFQIGHADSIPTTEAATDEELARVLGPDLWKRYQEIKDNGSGNPF